MIPNILIVDDSPVMRLFVKRVLKMAGIAAGSLLEAGNGEQALTMLRANVVQLVLTDVNMPGMNGEQMLRAMRAEQAFAHLPVIVISSTEQIDTAVRCIEAGAEDYLPKTYNPTLLRARVTSSVDKKRSRPSSSKCSIPFEGLKSVITILNFWAYEKTADKAVTTRLAVTLRSRPMSR